VSEGKREESKEEREMGSGKRVMVEGRRNKGRE
jgi:hypothetical protein